MNVDHERWLPVVDFEQYYEVSSHGRVRSFSRMISCHQTFERWCDGRILRGQVSKKWGYRYVQLSVDGKVKAKRVARIVALAFIQNPENKPQVNHKNGVRTDDFVSNLEWSTASEQKIHSCYELGHNVGISAHKAKLTANQVVDLRSKRAAGMTLTELQQFFPISQTSISKIARRDTYKTVT